MRFIFSLFACVATTLAQDTGRALIRLTEQDPTGSACGAYFRVDSGKIIYHIKGEEKSSSQPLDHIAKIVLADKVEVPSVIGKPIADGELLTIIISSTEKKAASCLPATAYIEKRQ